METINLAYSNNLFGQSEVLLTHPAFKEPISVAHERPEAIIREVEQILVVLTKATLAKYLTVVRKTKGSYLIGDDRQRLEDLNDLKGYFNRRMRLVTVQNALQGHLHSIGALLPREQSRFYPSQQAKYRYFQAVSAFELSQVEQLISSTAKTRL